MIRTKKTCRFREEKIDIVDWRDTKRISKYVTEQGKIMGRRTTGVCARSQRQLTKAIKIARHLALLPFSSDMTK